MATTGGQRNDDAAGLMDRTQVGSDRQIDATTERALETLSFSVPTDTRNMPTDCVLSFALGQDPNIHADSAREQAFSRGDDLGLHLGNHVTETVGALAFGRMSDELERRGLDPWEKAQWYNDWLDKHPQVAGRLVSEVAQQAAQMIGKDIQGRYRLQAAGEKPQADLDSILASVRQAASVGEESAYPPALLTSPGEAFDAVKSRVFELPLREIITAAYRSVGPAVRNRLPEEDSSLCRSMGRVVDDMLKAA